MKHLKRFNENFNQDELLTESIVGKIFDRLGYTDDVLRKSIKDTLNVDEQSSKEEVIQKTKELFNGSDNKRKLLRVAKTLGIFGEIITSLVVLLNVPWTNWTWLGTVIYMLLSHRENNLIRKPFKDIIRNDEFFNDEEDKKSNESLESPIEKVVVYCRAYDAGDGYVGDRWYMTEEEAWDVEEGEPNVIRVETYVGSNVYKAAKNRTGAR